MSAGERIASWPVLRQLRGDHLGLGPAVQSPRSKGSASLSLVTSPAREQKVKYRRPHGTEWEELSLTEAMDRIADRVIATRAATWPGA